MQKGYLAPILPDGIARSDQVEDAGSSTVNRIAAYDDSGEFASNGGLMAPGGYNIAQVALNSSNQNISRGPVSALPRPRAFLEENIPGSGIYHYTVSQKQALMKTQPKRARSGRPGGAKRARGYLPSSMVVS